MLEFGYLSSVLYQSMSQRGMGGLDFSASIKLYSAKFGQD
ncbi:3-hydroxyisobutyrate dehydrogenase (EC 1.1.1.31) [Mycetohabitans rhizoxinica HKI 454]|uniref:3-hydroxyisobutyrate dehydrogenase n=1 Tax=Mycetohabitans rhizoxinica (strain DSM 19002 / CIP 109453 / HKI 454) TaxID=882378 RepID=E5ARZ9_MYCRK|nr:3-hydroxyisobutyrate dehydrogenase (EC 1.1.1.31) [Mycetohabitans rhizoxinica HKI 454]